jgi:hypothetical protein
VPEEQIGKTLDIQKGEAQVDAAFAKPGQPKAILANGRKEAGF